MAEIVKNIAELEKSINITHQSEKIIFQNGLQQKINNHCLEVELIKEKTRNKRLKRAYHSEFNSLLIGMFIIAYIQRLLLNNHLTW